LKRGIYILIIFYFSFGLQAQERDTANIDFGFVEGEDTLIHKNIKDVYVFPNKQFKSKRHQRKYSRYVQKVKKVYPLAVKAQELLIKYEPEYLALEKQRDKRRLMKRLEKELLREHKDELVKWSISDGRILLKLINRETEKTPYSIIKDFRGDVSAIFWQGIARLFKNNLKAGYSPEEEDRILEEIVTLIELGYL